MEEKLEDKSLLHERIYNAESVGIGHPDKICDLISDTILDEALKQDPTSHIACEVVAMNNLIVVGGEIRTNAIINVQECVWKVIIPLGYDYHTFTIISNLNTQSDEINAKVDKTKKELNLKNPVFTKGSVGAGDQGITTGYATQEGDIFNIKDHNYLPLESLFANEVLRYLQEHINNKDRIYSDYLLYDQKSQIELIKDFENKTLIFKKVILALQHKRLNDKEYKSLIESIKTDVVAFFKERFGIELNEDIVKINEGGSFILGGPQGDSGLTGRKLVVDNYGPNIAIGGGAFSGKDYTKVDRSGAYVCRWIAKSLVANKLCDEAKVYLAFEIGQTKPDNIYIETKNAKINDKKLYKLIEDNFEKLDLASLINDLQLARPIYSKFNKYGHFSNKNAPWEKVKKLKI